MKKLYLHLGYAKTGTTSFQETCAINAKSLLEQGFFYPSFKSEYTDLEIENNHGHVFLSLYHAKPESLRFNIDNNVKDIAKLHKDYIDQLENCLSLDKNIIISGEVIPNLSKETLREFKATLESCNFEIIPFIVIRSPYAFSCSLSQDMIKWGLENQDFYVQSPMIEKIKEVFPNTLFYAFNTACNHKDGALAFLFEKIGIDYTNFDFIRKNEGISNIITRVQDRINKNTLKRIDNATNANFIDLTSYDSKEFKDKYLLTEEEYTKIKSYCDNENAYMQEHLGNEFTDKKIKFSKEDDILKLCLSLIDRLEKN